MMLTFKFITKDLTTGEIYSFKILGTYIYS